MPEQISITATETEWKLIYDVLRAVQDDIELEVDEIDAVQGLMDQIKTLNK